MTGREWDVEIVGLVTRPEGNILISVVRGAYRMREVADERAALKDYEFSREGFPTFRLSFHEVSQYDHTKDLKIDKIAKPWP